MEGTFREWLTVRVGDTAGKVSQRELARRLAARNRIDPENARRTIGRIVRGEVKASRQTREAIQDALDDHTAPGSDEPITREMVCEELRRIRRNSLRLERLLASGVAF